MNIVHITGNLTADIEVVPLRENTLCKFTLACNQEERTLFLPIEVWNQDHLQSYLKKGSKVLLSGYLKQETWQNKEGENRSRIVFVTHNVEFIDLKSRGKFPTDSNRNSSKVAAAA